jgi:hypothetical protein
VSPGLFGNAIVISEGLNSLDQRIQSIDLTLQASNERNTFTLLKDLILGVKDAICRIYDIFLHSVRIPTVQRYRTGVNLPYDETRSDRRYEGA